jgi:hypothetical protein
MTTLVTFLEDLILSWVIVYATYSLVRLAARTLFGGLSVRYDHTRRSA